jgi:Leucine-rich repeat (LRR) protein
MKNCEYRDNQDLSMWTECVTTLDMISTTQRFVSFYREKNSHKGIKNYASSITRLVAKQVNQDFFDELCQLEQLEYLSISTLTADSILYLVKLKNLKTLKIESCNKVTDFTPILELPKLTRLFIENAKNLHSLDFLSEADQLIALGIEGGMYKKQKLESLSPLSGLKALEALFLSSVQLKDKSLKSLSDIPSLSVLKCARLAPKEEFYKLRELMPELQCNWCDKYEI